MSEYIKQVADFCTKYGVKLTILDEEYRKYFPGDKYARWVFKCKLTRNRKSYTFNFGQSIVAGGKEPNVYDILACLTKYDPESFENFCSEYGYDEDSRTAERTYKAVVKEWKAVERLFPEEEVLDELREIY